MKTEPAAPFGYADLLRTYLRPQWRSVLVLALLLAASIALQLVNPWILKNFIDLALGKAELTALAQLAAIFLVAAVLNQIVAVVQTLVAENVGLTATNALRADLTQHCLELDLGFHHAHPPGELIERIDGDVEQACSGPDARRIEERYNRLRRQIPEVVAVGLGSAVPAVAFESPKRPG